MCWAWGCWSFMKHLHATTIFISCLCVSLGWISSSTVLSAWVKSSASVWQLCFCFITSYQMNLIFCFYCLVFILCLGTGQLKCPWMSCNDVNNLCRCFLSDKTRPVASIIENILQCALDFRSCLTGGICDVGMDQEDLLGTFSRINISQVILTSLLKILHTQHELQSVLITM